MFAGLVAMATLGCAEPPRACSNGSAVPVASADGALNAWIFVRSCETEPRDSVHVSVLPEADPAPSGPGNAFQVEGIHSVSVDWRSEGELWIHHAAGAIFTCESPDTEVVVRCPSGVGAPPR